MIPGHILAIAAFLAIPALAGGGSNKFPFTVANNRDRIDFCLVVMAKSVYTGPFKYIRFIPTSGTVIFKDKKTSTTEIKLNDKCDPQIINLPNGLNIGVVPYYFPDNPPELERRWRDEHAFEREVRSMKLSSHKPRTHLVNLIVTFRLKNHYYLVFPWAEGNFWDFAQTYEFGPHPTSDIQQRVWARLLAIQIHDIASGIQAIHVIRLSTTTEIYGRHGDIKPKNILCTGINAITRTYYGTYQASEFETIGKTSQVSGIWALGCIYLEITTWYLGYKEAYDGFSDALLTQSSFVDQLSEDTFYHIVKTPYYGIRAVIKEEVIEWVDRLHYHPQCTAYVQDLLDFVMNHMPVVDEDPSKRANNNPAVSQLQGMLEKCFDGQAYCLPPDASRPWVRAA
ncbi:hypothetical protein PgNI_10219 [Pyricularia grisea]|uniref:Protein kinase domain-containing protein n=1 Tax=Pyricularia grisea TaxID=148305 RepID=A0A6P8AZ22_PYRGI|nr:hypothetical protein PgNI_10219 [Pyricularia grisea]TLD07592.1 hypothetical protein PgNI_10219 [Pyricularia grisea]